jgi:hypothetical protein
VRAVGVGEGVAGLPGDLILIDDPIKNRKEAYSETFRNALWEWYTEDIYTRLEPGGAIVITMTRRHEDDLVGRILASEDAKDWVVIRLPALAEEDDELGRRVGEALCPERYDEKTLKKIRARSASCHSRRSISSARRRRAVSFSNRRGGTTTRRAITRSSRTA